MIEAIQTKALELVNRVIDAVRSEERGQTTAEYVAVTAVGVAIAVTVMWFLLKAAIETAIGNISAMLTGFVP